jgi:hypothetical protein
MIPISNPEREPFLRHVGFLRHRMVPWTESFWPIIARAPGRRFRLIAQQNLPVRLVGRVNLGLPALALGRYILAELNPIAEPFVRPDEPLE